MKTYKFYTTHISIYVTYVWFIAIYVCFVNFNDEN